MKKIILMMLVLTVLFSVPVTAEAMGVQAVGGPDSQSEPVSLDDVKLNVEAEIDGYGIFLPNEFEFADRLGFYCQGYNEVNFNNGNWCYQSGNDAEYAILRVDITNTALGQRDFLANCEVKAVYDDVYEYAGWCYQVNYDNKISTNALYDYGEDKGKQNTRWVINEADNFSIGPMYTGHYVFGCTLPNSIVNAKKPLKLIITIDSNEITYNIRK